MFWEPFSTLREPLTTSHSRLSTQLSSIPLLINPPQAGSATWLLTLKASTKRLRVGRGCPQGGILSPFLWNLVVDSLLETSAKGIPGYLQAFADDLVILAEGDDLDIIRTRTQQSINTIERWCASKGLTISALKTKIVMFTWKRKWSLKPIQVGGIDIPLSNTVKFLGITLDSKLNFNSHISNITRKATASLMQCKRAVGPTWGLTPSICKWIYTVAIRPIISYGSVKSCGRVMHHLPLQL